VHIVSDTFPQSFDVKRLVNLLNFAGVQCSVLELFKIDADKPQNHLILCL